MLKSIFKNGGFSLVELIITLSILMIVSVPLSGYFLQSAKTNQAAREQITAGNMAQGKIEEWKSDKSIGIIDETDIASSDGRYVIRTVAIPVANYIESSVVQQPNSSPDAVTKQVKVAEPALGTIKNYTNEDYADKNTSPVPADIELEILPSTSTVASNIIKSINPISSLYYDITAHNTLNINFNSAGSLLNISNASNPAGTTFDGITKNELKVKIKLNASILPSEPLFLNVSNDSSKKLQIYIINGQDPSASYYSDGNIITNISSKNTYVYKGYFDTPVTNEGNRLYRIEVSVFKIGDVNKTKPIVKLVSYKGME